MKFQLGDNQPLLLGDTIFVAPTAVVLGQVEVGDFSSIWFQAVVRGDNDLIKIGSRCNIQEGAVLHTDPGLPLSMSDNVTVGHLAMLHGCTIGCGSLIGIHATVLNGAVIGEHCLIGANTLVTEGMEIPANSLVLGSPGKVVRSLRQEEITALQQSADSYVRKLPLYLDELKNLDA